MDTEYKQPSVVRGCLWLWKLMGFYLSAVLIQMWVVILAI